MKKISHSPAAGLRRAPSFIGALFAIAPFIAITSLPWANALAQSAPIVLSFSPGNGEQGVAPETPIVITFDQPLAEDTFPTQTFEGFYVGNFEIQPSGLFVAGELSGDRLTLTLSPDGSPFPPNTEITWTLNPPGTAAFIFPLANAAGQEVATFTRSFTTGGETIPAPVLDGVIPDYDATDVPANTFILFDFDLEMDTGLPPQLITEALPFGNIEIAPAGTAERFTAEWDGSSGIVLFNTTPLDPGTVVTWILNPAGTFTPLMSIDGGILPETSGSFTVAGESTGDNEECDPMEDGLGEYGILKSIGHEQISANEVIPLEDEEAFFGAFAESPDAGPDVTAGSITLPDVEPQPLSNSFSIFSFFRFLPDEATLEEIFPPGNYVLRFTLGGTERSVSMTVPSTFSSIPMITNYAAAQAIDSTQGFTIEWGEFSGQGIEQRIAITITDTDPLSFDKIVFTAPNECIPRELLPTATSIEIPAGFLQPGKTYSGELEFSDGFYLSETAVPGMSGFGSISRYTRFEIRTLGGGGGELNPATFINLGLDGEGKPSFSMLGTPLGSYTLYRFSAVDLPFESWENLGTVSMDGTGSAPFTDHDASLTFPAFYQAVGN